MLHFYDRATMAHALTLDLDPTLKALLRARIKGFSPDLIDYTEYLVVEPGDTEEDIVRHVGFSPMINPIDGARFGEPTWHPFCDWLCKHDGWYELIVTFGSAFAYILLIADQDGTLPILRSLCSGNETSWTVPD